MSHRLCPALAAIPLLLLPACSSSFRATETRTTTEILAAPAPALHVSSRNGPIDVAVEAARTDLWIEAKITAGGGSDAEAQSRLASVTIDVSRQGDVVTVKPIFPQPTHSSDGAALKIRLPALSTLQIDTSNGGITAADIPGDIEVETSNGAVTLARISGAVGVETSNGAVKVTTVSGPVEVDSSNGAITVEDASGDIDIDTSNGSITIRLPDTFTASVDAETSNGPIAIHLPETLNGTLTAETSNGGIIIDDPGDAIHRQKVTNSLATLKLGNGGPASSLRTSNGRIHIHTRKNGA